MGRLYQRKQGGNWWGAWTDDDGEPRRESLKTKDRHAARARLRAREIGQANRELPRAAESVRVAIGKMMAGHGGSAATLDSYEQKSVHLIRLLGALDLDELTTPKVNAYCRKRISEGVSRHTVHKELVVLRLALKDAGERSVGPGAAIVPKYDPKYVPRTRWMTEDELRKLLAELPAKRRLWVVLHIYTSSNYSETEGIGAGDVDLEHGWIRIRGTKRESRWRRVPISDVLRPWLVGADLPVEHWGNYRRDLAAACKSAKIPSVTSNDLRRTFGSWLAQRGVPLKVIADMMGHTSTRMVERVYGQLSEQTYRDAIATLPAMRVLTEVK